MPSTSIDPPVLSLLPPVVSGRPAAQGYLKVRDDRGERAYLLGPRTALDGDAPMLDWRQAPLAEVFFRHGPGEAYEVEVGERTVAGTVVERWLVDGDTLVGEDRARTAAGERPLARPAPAATTAAHRDALPVLDGEQQAAVDLPAGTSLVLDGEAGVGKTLVALYRLAALSRRAAARGRRFRALVLVPTEGLRRLVRILAERLELSRLEVAVFDEWATERGRAAFTGLPARRSSNAAAQVIGLKRHPAVRAVLDDFVGWKPPRGVDDERIPRSRMRLYHLFGDRDRLQRVVDAAGGALPARAIAAVMAHTRAQFEISSERAFQHVDAERLVALDGRRLDAGTPDEDAESHDAEDVPVLFELVRRGALPARSLPRYDHIVVDEAQLRAPLELAMVGDALDAGAAITLAGDHRQATDESAWFTGWAGAQAELGRAAWAEVTLAVTYRSVPAIAAFARALVDGAAPVAAGEADAGAAAGDAAGVGAGRGAGVDGAVCFTRVPTALAQAASLCWHLAALVARDPWRQICVVGRTPEHARRLHAELSRGLDPVLVLDGDFRFEPGVVVTFAAALSGLEFDAVVIPDLGADFYPRATELARALYVTATRARDWLWMLSPAPWSPLVRSLVGGV